MSSQRWCSKAEVRVCASREIAMRCGETRVTQRSSAASAGACVAYPCGLPGSPCGANRRPQGWPLHLATASAAALHPSPSIPHQHLAHSPLPLLAGPTLLRKRALKHTPVLLSALRLYSKFRLPHEPCSVSVLTMRHASTMVCDDPHSPFGPSSRRTFLRS